MDREDVMTSFTAENCHFVLSAKHFLLEEPLYVLCQLLNQVSQLKVAQFCVVREPFFCRAAPVGDHVVVLVKPLQ